MREPIPIGPFRLDPAGRSVARADGTLLPLGTRAMDLLLVLARANGEVVSKAVIMDAVWPGLVVEENNLPTSTLVGSIAMRARRSGHWAISIRCCV